MGPEGPGESAAGSLDATDVHPGDVLAGRFRVEDLIGEVGGSGVWRATDEVLNRSVGVQELRATDPRASGFLDAARASTAVTDPRFLRVLDVADDEAGHAYVVREWARAVSLAALLRAGPMSNRRGAGVVSEVAAAVDAAHEVGRTHRRLDPTTVFVKDSGAVRISGLGTDYALLGGVAAQQPARASVAGGARLAPRTPVEIVEAAEQEDVLALGRLLYACLVARWPGGSESSDGGLPPAPTEHGRLLRPRQVRAGISREADTVCDQVLGRPPRHHRPPLRSARDVAQALALVGDDPAALHDSQPSLGGGEHDPFGGLGAFGALPQEPPPPALLPEVRPARRNPPPAAVTGSGAPDPPRAAAGARRWVWLAVLCLLGVLAVTAYAITRGPEPDVAGSARSTPTTSAGTPGQREPRFAAALPVASASSFDPQGDDGTEHESEAPAAVDGLRDTTWTTLEYYGDPEMAGKDGVGLLLDLAQERQVTGVDVRFGAEPTSYQVFTAPPGTTEPPTTLAGLDRLGGQRDAGLESAVTGSTPVLTRYLVLWLTSLPEESPGTYVGVVDEVSPRGLAS